MGIISSHVQTREEMDDDQSHHQVHAVLAGGQGVAGHQPQGVPDLIHCKTGEAANVENLIVRECCADKLGLENGPGKTKKAATMDKLAVRER